MQERKEIRLETRLTHAKDREIYARLRADPTNASIGEAELLRIALRNLDRGDAFHQLLLNFERRMGASLQGLHRRLDQISSENQMALAFLEVLMRTFYFHTLPVPVEGRSTAAAQANRRAAKFIEDVASLLQAGSASQQILVQLRTSAGMEA